MNVTSELRAQLDNEGRLALPSDLLAHFGLEPGVQVRIDRRSSGLHLRQPVTYLGKVYIEPTNACNLECRTCIRNVWDEPLGRMTDATFERVVQELMAPGLVVNGKLVYVCFGRIPKKEQVIGWMHDALDS